MPCAQQHQNHGVERWSDRDVVSGNAIRARLAQVEEGNWLEIIRYCRAPEIEVYPGDCGNAA